VQPSSNATSETPTVGDAVYEEAEATLTSGNLQLLTFEFPE
jgi:hypothetical protein